MDFRLGWVICVVPFHVFMFVILAFRLGTGNDSYHGHRGAGKGTMHRAPTGVAYCGDDFGLFFTDYGVTLS
jgi:hypothetical protein